MQMERRVTAMLTNYPLRLTLNLLLGLFILKIYFFATDTSERSIIYIVSLVQDSFLILANYFLCVRIIGKFPRLSSAGRFLFFSLHLLLGVTSFAYTFFLSDLMNFSINLFGITGETISFFMRYFVSPKLILLLGASSAAIYGISRYFPKSLRWKRLPILAGICLTLLFIPTVLRPAVNPIVYSLQEQILLTLTSSEDIQKLTSPTPDSSKSDQFRFLNKSLNEVPKLKIRFDRVILLVMEGVGYDEFTFQSLADPNSFTTHYKQRVTSYSNYYSLNLDSYTSLIAMLQNLFVPYQAYVNEEKYASVRDFLSLVHLFNANGFTTHFLTSYGEQQKRFVPVAHEWTQIMCKTNIEASSPFACVTTNKIEYACEDRAVFDDLMDLLVRNRRAFVFQEMV